MVASEPNLNPPDAFLRERRTAVKVNLNEKMCVFGKFVDTLKFPNDWIIYKLHLEIFNVFNKFRISILFDFEGPEKL